jgi:hypothetical protein
VGGVPILLADPQGGQHVFKGVASTHEASGIDVAVEFLRNVKSK